MLSRTEAQESAVGRPSWTTRLIWGALLAWLSPAILIVMAIGLVGVAASGTAGLAGKLARHRAPGASAPFPGPINRAA